jgi:hypothetical protein
VSRVSQSDSWSERDDATDAAEAAALADQMRAATRSLRARLSLVPRHVDEPAERGDEG